MNKTKKIIFIIVIVACVFWLGAYALMLIKTKAKKNVEEVDETEHSSSSNSSGTAVSDKAKSPFHKGSDTRSTTTNPIKQLQKLCNFYGTRAGRSKIDEDGVWGTKTEEAVEALTHTTIKTQSGAQLNYLQAPYIQGTTGSRRVWVSDLNKMIKFHNKYYKEIKVQ